MNRTTPTNIAVRAKFVSKEISDLIERTQAEFNLSPLELQTTIHRHLTDHIRTLASLDAAKVAIETGISILRALYNDPLEAATPAPKYNKAWGGKPPYVYGMYDGKPVMVPDGFEIVPEDEYPPAYHIRLVVPKIGDPVWRQHHFDSLAATHASKVYAGENGRTTIAYAREVK